VAASFLAPRTSVLRLAARVVAGQHPLHTAEQVAVADNISNGRLTLVLSSGGPDPEPLAETVRVVVAANAPRPFAHSGSRWKIPGLIADNDAEPTISVTPQPAQLELPVWLAGAVAPPIARDFGLSHVTESADSPEVARAAWHHAEHALRDVVARMRRPAIRDLVCASNGDFDDESLVERLAAESSRWGLDVALLRLPSDLDAAARSRAIARLATLVRPRLQMDRIPGILEAHWRRKLADRFGDG
jgi:alkanesulfonate monooxygenase SsuD/methylene tetrahydromethanopterin reductase-like flavin-dependent oxidoreductase (luciferase family)